MPATKLAYPKKQQLNRVNTVNRSYPSLQPEQKHQSLKPQNTKQRKPDFYEILTTIGSPLGYLAIHSQEEKKPKGSHADRAKDAERVTHPIPDHLDKPPRRTQPAAQSVITIKTSRGYAPDPTTTTNKQTYARSILPRATEHTTNGTGRNDRRSKPVPQRQT